jgi:hypothetical protein
MATTRLTDIVPIKLFAKLVEDKIVTNSKIRASGLVTTDPRFQVGPGFVSTLPFWKQPLAGEATSMNDDPASPIVPAKVGQGQLDVRVISRALAFEAMRIQDFTHEGDAIEFAASKFAGLRVADEELALIAMINGIMADNVANDAADMRVVKSKTTGTIDATNKFGAAALLAGRRTMGDLGNQLNIILSHSDVINNLREAEPNAYVPASKTDIGLATYMGIPIVETDNLTIDTTVAGFPVYTTYLAGPGLFGYVAGNVEKSLVEVSDEFAGGGSGKDTVINRFRYVLHPFGFHNKGTPANNVSQTNAELAVAATWDRVVASRKAVPLVQIKTNG